MTNLPDSKNGHSAGTAVFDQIRSSVEGVIRGKSDAVRLALCCLVARGHLLIEDNPGTGKTTLAKAVAGVFGGSVRRVQFTPDLLPSDITGVTVFDPRTTTFTFRKGPVFANILVADEINRASPKTQAALLEVMEERQVTSDGTSRPVPDPFMVVATQNPLDFQGTYPLPEVQLDRFAMKLSLGYAGREAELELLARSRRSDGDLEVRQVLDVATFGELSSAAEAVTVTQPLYGYVVDVVAATRIHTNLRLGVSTRGSLTLLAVARAFALSSGRSFVTPDDIKELAVPVLAHRIALTADAEIEGASEADVINDILGSVPIPRARATADA